MYHDTDRVIADVQVERRRQQAEEGWTPDHDDTHTSGEMAWAASCYAKSGLVVQHRPGDPPITWPWDRKWWKPKGYRANLVRAAALLVAEIERIDRATVKRMVAKMDNK